MNHHALKWGTFMSDNHAKAYATILEAAEYLNVSADTVRRLIYSKRLEAYKVGRVIRIPWAALTAALEPVVA
jgi:excisionase family DNA binding protein